MTMIHPTSEPIPHELRNAKGTNRIQINNNLTAVSLVILSLLLMSERLFIGVAAICQLALSIPLLATSSLAYAKSCYRNPEEYRKWDHFAWLTHSLGYLLILNSFTLILLRSPYHIVGWLFFSVNFLLHISYSVINVWCKPARITKTIVKMLIYTCIIVAGTIMPIEFGSV